MATSQATSSSIAALRRRGANSKIWLRKLFSGPVIAVSLRVWKKAIRTKIMISQKTPRPMAGSMSGASLPSPLTQPAIRLSMVVFFSAARTSLATSNVASQPRIRIARAAARLGR